MLLEKEISSSEQLSSVSTCLRPKCIKFGSQNSRNDREEINGCEETTFGFDNEKEFSDRFW